MSRRPCYEYGCELPDYLAVDISLSSALNSLFGMAAHWSCELAAARGKGQTCRVADCLFLHCVVMSVATLPFATCASQHDNQAQFV